MNLQSESKKIKSIHGKTFEISLMERPNGHYYVESLRISESLVKESHNMLDYIVACKVFDIMLRNMEGH